MKPAHELFRGLVVLAFGVLLWGCPPDDDGDGPTCGNGHCGDPGERLSNCPRDCGEACGDGDCETLIESRTSCPEDCGCGNGRCDGTETSNDCAEDCEVGCGDRVCAPWDGEDTESCSSDCEADCGNGVCDVRQGENSNTCFDDCQCGGSDDDDCGSFFTVVDCSLLSCCGDGDCGCDIGENDRNCPDDCDGSEACSMPPNRCGNSQCEPSYGETPQSCEADCDCGNGTCDQQTEDARNCPEDCLCGNGTCETARPVSETRFSCEADCECEDGVCDDGDEVECEADCYCGDTICSPGEACSGGRGCCESDCAGHGCRGAGCPDEEPEEEPDEEEPDEEPDEPTDAAVDAAVDASIVDAADPVIDAGDTDPPPDASFDAGLDGGAIARAAWARVYPPLAPGGDAGPPPSDDYTAKRLRPTSDGGAIAVVDTAISSSAPITTPLLVKLDASGAVSWTRRYDFDRASVVDVAELPASATGGPGYVVLGGRYAPNTDVGIVRTDLQGAVVWERTLGDQTTERPRSVLAHADGSITLLVGGVVPDTMPMGIPFEQALVVRLDPAGGVVWSKRAGGAGDHMSASLRADDDGGMLLVGSVGGTNLWNAWLAKLDSAGDVSWQRVFDHAQELYGQDVTRTADGGYLVTGRLLPGVLMQGLLAIKLDSDANPVWQKLYGSQFSNDLAVMSAVQVGSRSVLLNAPFDAVLAIDDAGSVIWSKQYRLSSQVLWQDAALSTADGSVLLAASAKEMNTAYRALLVQLDADGAIGASCSTLGQDLAVTPTDQTLTTTSPTPAQTTLTFTSLATSIGSASESFTATLMCGG